MYKYAEQKHLVFKEENQKTFLQIRDNCHRLTKAAGVFTAERAWQGCSGDAWVFLACLDRLVEMGEIRELNVGDTSGQNRVFLSLNQQ